MHMLVDDVRARVCVCIPSHAHAECILVEYEY